MFINGAKLPRLGVVFLLTLLQCLAPLLHAHAGGLGRLGGIHFQTEEALPIGPGFSKGPALLVERQDSPAIGVASEYKDERAGLDAYTPLPAASPRPPVPALRRGNAMPGSARIVFSRQRNHFLPLSNAPPLPSA